MIKTVTNTLRAHNYKRLAARSTRKANASMNKAIQYDFADPQRLAHDQAFNYFWNKRVSRLHKSKSLQ